MSIFKFCISLDKALVFSFEQEECALAAWDWSFLAQRVVIGEGLSKSLQGISGEDILTRGEQFLHLAVFLGDELDDQVWCEAGHPVGDIFQGQVVRNCQMVDQGQG